ncbi:hypothetical protein LA080_011632 [Diaporthe eres]|nr:hypothetical protein LA080_011632 [Diaporthe eres]
MAFFLAEPVGEQPMPADTPTLQPTQPEHRINRSSPEEMAASVLKAFPHQKGPVRVITIREGAVASSLEGLGKQGYTEELPESLRKMGLDFQHEQLEYGQVSVPPPAADKGGSAQDGFGDNTPVGEAGPARGEPDTHPEETDESQEWYRTWGLVLAPAESAGIFKRVCAFADMPYPVPPGRTWEDVKTTIVIQ